jgi:hypothetical protein
MKLTVGDKYTRKTSEYKEELEIVGCNADWCSDVDFVKGLDFVPEKDDPIKVRVINSISCEFFHTEISLKRLVNNWEKE